MAYLRSRARISSRACPSASNLEHAHPADDEMESGGRRGDFRRANSRAPAETSCRFRQTIQADPRRSPRLSFSRYDMVFVSTTLVRILKYYCCVLVVSMLGVHLTTSRSLNTFACYVSKRTFIARPAFRRRTTFDATATAVLRRSRSNGS